MLIPFMWLHLASNHLKNIWSEIEMIKNPVSPVFDIKVWEWNQIASDREQLHKILAALWSEERLSWFMS